MTKTKAFVDDFEEFDNTAETQQSEPAQEAQSLNEFRGGSLLTVDIGSVHTRAAFFDIVEGRARFLASGRAQTTAAAPLLDASEGIRFALEQVEHISGRIIMGQDTRPMIPTTPNGQGTDFMASTLSVGPPLKTVVVGLLDEVSLASVNNLAKTSYTDVVASIGLNTAQRPEEYIDVIQRVMPDLIMIAGGTDNGASQSVLRLVNTIGMALYLMSEANRPNVLFAGNPALAKQVKRFIKPLTRIQTAPNIRPTLAAERLGPAQSILTQSFKNIHIGRVSGIGQLSDWSSGNLIPTANALGRVTRFFSKIIPNRETNGVLGVDVGASSTTIAGSFDGDLRLRVFTEYGMGSGLKGILKNSKLEDVTRWIPAEVNPEYVLNYIQNKIIYPSSLPVTNQDLYVENALAREVLRNALEDALASFPKNVNRLEANTLPTFDPIMVSGAVFSNSPSLVHSMLMILDALQPTGIQRILLDKNHLIPGLGAASKVAPALVSQLLLDPTVLLNLGFVISPISKARSGSQVLKIRVQYESGYENTINIHQGNIRIIQIPTGQRARVYIDPLQRANIGFGPGKSTSVRIVGGHFGLVIDARGRPLQLPQKFETRRNLLLKWQQAFSQTG